jgi:DNA-binding LytR/AlgR family response regulator
MTTALIAEDEPHIRAQLAVMLAELWPDLHIVAQAADGVSALAAIRAHEPDVLFLDVKMPGLSGVEVLQAAGQGARRYVTVLITAFDDFAVTAFDEGAVDYLVKPVSAARLAKALMRVQEKLTSRNALPAPALSAPHTTAPPSAQPLRWIQATQGDRVLFVTINEVLFFQSDSKYTRVVTKDREAFIRKSIKSLIDELDPNQFMQIHRGVLINVNFIDVVERHSLRGMQVRLRGHASALQIAQPYAGAFRGM